MRRGRAATQCAAPAAARAAGSRQHVGEARRARSSAARRSPSPTAGGSHQVGEVGGDRPAPANSRRSQARARHVRRAVGRIAGDIAGSAGSGQPSRALRTARIRSAMQTGPTSQALGTPGTHSAAPAERDVHPRTSSSMLDRRRRRRSRRCSARRRPRASSERSTAPARAGRIRSVNERRSDRYRGRASRSARLGSARAFRQRATRAGHRPSCRSARTHRWQL